MKPYLRSWFVRVGIILIVAGSGPLVGFMTYAKLGFSPDPNPNPVYLGILAGLTFWPSVLLIVLGVWRVNRNLVNGREER
jgi:hypothetical protein